MQLFKSRTPHSEVTKLVKYVYPVIAPDRHNLKKVGLPDGWLEVACHGNATRLLICSAGDHETNWCTETKWNLRQRDEAMKDRTEVKNWNQFISVIPPHANSMLLGDPEENEIHHYNLDVWKVHVYAVVGLRRICTEQCGNPLRLAYSCIKKFLYSSIQVITSKCYNWKLLSLSK